MEFTVLRRLLQAKPGAREEFPFGPEVLVYKVADRMFALLLLDREPLWLNLKGDPAKAPGLRSCYPAIRPGYHMNKRHWNTLVLDGSLPDGLVGELIDESYALVVAGLPRHRRPSA